MTVLCMCVCVFVFSHAPFLLESLRTLQHNCVGSPERVFPEMPSMQMHKSLDGTAASNWNGTCRGGETRQDVRHNDEATAFFFALLLVVFFFLVFFWLLLVARELGCTLGFSGHAKG